MGKWREMIQAFPAELGRYKDTDVRVHAARLLGTQSLARHVGWKGEAGGAMGAPAWLPPAACTGMQPVWQGRLRGWAGGPCQ